jgi:hypothetical protein
LGGGAPVADRQHRRFPAIREKIESAPKIDRTIDKKTIKINSLRRIPTLGQQGADLQV